MARFIRGAVLTIVGMLGFACASNRVTVFTAPSNETIQAGSEMTLSGDGQVVYVYNHSSLPIVITGLQLIECENIRNSCDVQRLRIEAPPGQRVNIATVRPANPNGPYSYRYHYSWEPVHQQ